MSENLAMLALELLCLASAGGMLLSYRETQPHRSMQLLWILLLGKLYFYLLDLRLFTTFHHTHLFLVFLLITTRENQLFFQRIGLVVVYFSSALGKLNDSWIRGEYLLSVEGGLPLLGGLPGTLRALSIGVVVLEVVGPLCWFLPSRRVRQCSLFAFLIFHLYSGFIVGFSYPVLMLPALLLAAYPLENPVQRGYHPNKSEVLPWLVIWTTALLATTPLFIGSDTRYTAEGRYFQMGNMFDAHRAIQYEARLSKDGTPYILRIIHNRPSYGFYGGDTLVLLSRNNRPFEHLRDEWVEDGRVLVSPAYFQKTNSRLLGDPYLYLYLSRKIQERFAPESFSLELKCALNREAEFRTVFRIPEYEKNAFKFAPWQRNEWVRD